MHAQARTPMMVLHSLLCGACTPVLTSPDQGGDTAGGDWTAPENTWPSTDGPPASLAAGGFHEGEVAPEVLLMDQNGDMVSLWQFYGMVIALDVSTMWCGPCRILAADVNATYQDYLDLGFMYVTLLPEDNVGEVPDVADLQAWASDYGIQSPVLSDDQGYSYEIVPDGTYPRIMIIGRDMRVVEDQVTPAEDAAIRAAIEAEL